MTRLSELRARLALHDAARLVLRDSYRETDGAVAEADNALTALDTFRRWAPADLAFALDWIERARPVLSAAIDGACLSVTAAALLKEIEP